MREKAAGALAVPSIVGPATPNLPMATYRWRRSVLIGCRYPMLLLSARRKRTSQRTLAASGPGSGMLRKGLLFRVHALASPRPLFSVKLHAPFGR
jgi:hypothetical protein